MTQALDTNSFTREGIIDFLHQKSICGCIDATLLSEQLGTITPRMIRHHVQNGNLKAVQNNCTYYVFKVEDVAEWLLQYPQYLFKKKVDNSDMTTERFEYLSKFIRDYATKRFPAILKYMNIDDVVMEAIEIYMKSRHDNVSDATAAFRAILKLYKKYSKRVDTETIDPSSIEKMYAGEDDEELNS